MSLLRRKHLKFSENVLLSFTVSQVDIIIEHLPIREWVAERYGQTTPFLHQATKRIMAHHCYQQSPA